MLWSQPRVDGYYLAMISLRQVISGHEIIRIGAKNIRDEPKPKPELAVSNYHIDPAQVQEILKKEVQYRRSI